jgi:epoxyqueuosine reductase
MVYGCDICQDVCPWNRGIEKRRRGLDPAHGADGRVSLADWLTRDGDELVAEVDRLYVPRNEARWLRRNALIAAGNIGTRQLESVVRAYEDDSDPIVSDAAQWALARIADRDE